MPVVPRPEGFRVDLSSGGNAYRPMGFDMPEVPDTSDQIRSGVKKLQGVVGKLIEQQDEARVSDALTKLRRHAIDVEAGDNGFLKLQGENALKPDENGLGLVDRVDTDMRKYGDALASELNDRQRQLFNEKAQTIYLSSYGSASEHVHNEGLAYQQNAAVAAIDQYIEEGAVYAGRPDYIAKSRAGIAEQVGRLAELRGLSDDQRENLMRKSVSGLYMNAINSVMANADRDPSVAYRAQGILQNNSRDMLASDVVRAKTQINRSLEILDKSKSIENFLQKGDETRMQLTNDYMNLLEKGSESRIAKGTVEAFHYGILPQVSAGGHQTVVNTKDDQGRELPAESGRWRYGGSQMTVADAMDTAKAHGVTWDRERFVKDRGYNISLGFLRYSEIVKNYAGDETAALSSWFSSDDTVAKAIESARRDGAPNDWFNYMPKEVREKVAYAQKNMRKMSEVRGDNGEKISAFSPEYVRRLPRWQTAEQAREYFRATNPRAASNPAYCEELVNGAVARINQQKASYAQDQANRMATVLDALWQNGGDMTAIPQSYLAELDVNQLGELRTKAAKIAINDQSSDPYVKAKLMTDDAYLLSLPMDALKVYAMGSLSREDQAKVLYRRSMLEQKQIQANDAARENVRGAATGVINSDFVPSAESVRTVLKEDPSYVKLKENNTEAAAQLEMNVIEALTFEAMRDNAPLKDVLTIRQKVNSIRRNYATVDGFWGNKEKPAFMLQVSDLPNGSVSDAQNIVTTIAKTWLAGKGVSGREPTDGEKQEVLTKLMLAKGTPPFDIPNLNDALARQIEARYQARRESRDPMPRLLKLQAWLIARAGGTMAEAEREESTMDNLYFSFGEDYYSDFEGQYGND